MSIGIPYTITNPNQNPFTIGPLYLKFDTYPINFRYALKTAEGFKCFDQSITIDKCNMEIPIDKNLYDC
jgi:hypothetical protein